MSTTLFAGQKSGMIFLHEIRMAIRENRWILPVPTLFMLAVVLSSRRAWNPADGIAPGWVLAGPIDTLNEFWPWMAWAFPWLILKRPDPADPTAFWRALPSGVIPVFGARLAVAMIFTVVIPALALGGGLGLQTSEFFWPQTGETCCASAHSFGLVPSPHSPRKDTKDSAGWPCSSRSGKSDDRRYARRTGFTSRKMPAGATTPDTRCRTYLNISGNGLFRQGIQSGLSSSCAALAPPRA